MAKWQCCPVCGGNGLVSNGFYLVPLGETFTSSSASPEECRTCTGSGIILEFEEDTTVQIMNFPESDGENPCDI